MFTSRKYPPGIHNIKYKKVKPFWTKREYQYQQLIINGFAVQRETLPKAQYESGKDAMPKARIDIYYDTGNGVGSKKILGYESFVYEEAINFLDPGEISELNRKWKQAYADGYFDYDDPNCKKDLFTYDLPPWIYFDEAGQAKDKKDWNKNLRKDYPLRDLFLTQKFDAKEVVKDKDLSTFYKHIRGDLELTKRKAMEYGEAINIAPQALMFNPMRIIIWGNVNLTHNVTYSGYNDQLDPLLGKNFPEVHTTGSIYLPEKIESVIAPAELYRVDLKAVKVKSKESIYNNFVAYYYEADKVPDDINNKLCLVREWKNKGHNYYLGIYQIYGTKKRILNPDPTSENKIIAADVKPDLVAPIISFTKPEALEADKMLSTNLKDTQKLGKLIRDEEVSRINIGKKKIEIQKAIIDRASDAKKTSQKNLDESKRLVKELEEKHQVMYEYLTEQFYKLKVEQEKKGLLKKSFIGDLFKKQEELVELPSDYELPKDEDKVA